MDRERTLPTCYRHPDRETRLACSTCDRPVCIDCVRPAAVGQKCPECAAPQGRSRVISAEEVRAGSRGTTPVVYSIIVVCVAIFVAQFLIPEVREVVYARGAQANIAVAQGEWYRLFTAAFLHSPGFLMHIAFNMFALYLFGPQLERQAGSPAFAALYIASALAGGAAYYLFGPLLGQAVGASGAIFGLFGAWLAAAVHTRHTAMGQAGLRQLLVLLGINMALPLVVPAIAWQAHLGGLIAGFLVASAWIRMEGQRNGARSRMLVALGVAAVSLLTVVVV